MSGFAKRSPCVTSWPSPGSSCTCHQKAGSHPRWGGHRMLGWQAGNRNNKKMGRGYEFLLPLTRLRDFATSRPRPARSSTDGPAPTGPRPTEGRTLQPHARGRVGLRRLMRQRRSPRSDLPELDPSLQSPQTPHRHRRPNTLRPRSQPHGEEQTIAVDSGGLSWFARTWSARQHEGAIPPPCARNPACRRLEPGAAVRGPNLARRCRPFAW